MGNLTLGASPEEGIISRVWRKNDPLFPFKIVARINRGPHRSDTIVHVYHHFNLYGGPLSIPPFLLLLLMLHIRGYPVVVQPQSVVDSHKLGELNRADSVGLPRPLLAAGLQLFYRLLGGLGNRVAVCTPSMRSLLVERYGVDPERVWVVPVGWRAVASPPGEFAPRGTVAPSRHVVIVFHGFLDPTKGLGYLLDAFARVHLEYPESRLVFAGEVSPHLGSAGVAFVESLEKQVVALGLEGAVEFTGYVDDGRLGQVLSAADLFVLPYTMLASHGGSASLSRVAGFGKPLIASRISRFADEIIDGETGLLVTPGKPEEIAAAIRRILSDPALASRLGDNLRRLAHERTWKASAELLDRDLYPSLPKGSAR